MSDPYVPALRQRFLEDMRIKGAAAQDADDVSAGNEGVHAVSGTLAG